MLEEVQSSDKGPSGERGLLRNVEEDFLANGAGGTEEFKKRLADPNQAGQRN